MRNPIGYVEKPQKYKNSRGDDLFGYPPEMLSQAAAYYAFQSANLNFDEAESTLESIRLSLTIEELASIMKRALFKNYQNVYFLRDKKNVNQIILALYREYLNRPESEIRRLLTNWREIYTRRWEEVVPDEDNVSPEQLHEFYNSFPFPVGCFIAESMKSNLSLAFRALPILVARANNCRRAFDFGGSSGMITSAMAGSLELDSCMLIEENEKMLEFAKWRDRLMAVQNVTYKKESEIFKEIAAFEGTFDFGVCTEVLEHTYYVEETVEVIAKLLNKGGLLYLSASFGMYPEPSHLKKNIKYYGKEDALLASFGLERVHLDLPLPLLDNVGIYLKR